VQGGRFHAQASPATGDRWDGHGLSSRLGAPTSRVGPEAAPPRDAGTSGAGPLSRSTARRTGEPGWSHSRSATRRGPASVSTT
jgi:hypothetical protein